MQDTPVEQLMLENVFSTDEEIEKILKVVNSMLTAEREDYLLSYIEEKLEEMVNSPPHKIKTLLI